MWKLGGATPAKSDATFDLAAVIDDDFAFRNWYDMTAPRVYAYLSPRPDSRISGPEELTQETFVEVVRSPRTFDGRDDALPWVIGVARHRLSRHWRRNKLDDGRSATLIREVQVAGDDDRSWRQVEQGDAVAVAMAALPPDQRAALMLQFVDGLSIERGGEDHQPVRGCNGVSCPPRSPGVRSGVSRRRSCFLMIGW